ncbi:biotin carboxylase N-terminal domain-containing protein [Paenarthrobacter nicotinovorans]|uniref:ATP-binding protein n=1 Tax=Paenarthrobacter nicotinovorans TaxID=29320 RepID=UPI0024865AF0|nr:biotin carboxylase N-terminal domain-containing protein [Paenarthrobacter nicotinovorans]MDI2020124.1 Acetyl-/propionyl-coenzyme A carboxylase alpha chain [Paenarthrobacter nicotinovorans]
MNQTFRSILIANRGEIACRIISTLRKMGIRSIAVYSEADAAAKHVHLADEAILLGPAPAVDSYLNIDALLSAVKASGADAVHPGYGFLSENESFARALADAGVVFIGPGLHALNVMGDKIRSKNHVMEHGVPVVPGVAQPGLSNEMLEAAAADIGYPLLIKPSAGGGGKGMHVVDHPGTLSATLVAARRVAASAFGDDTLFLERLVAAPRHIEVQVLADNHGNVVHLGERECSLQRRHQKVIEEAPSSLLDEATRSRIGEAACNAARSVGYSGAGTVEFLVSDSAPDEFFFMEMNTRLQVEHPVTEMVTGVDLVEWQVRIAAGQTLDLTQDDIVLTGHSVEARVYAENPERGFLPTSGTVLDLREPTGAGIRVDSALEKDLEITPHYDPMLSKIITWGKDRTEALDRLDQALSDSMVLGLRTNIEYLRLLVADEDVRAGRLDTTMIERKMSAFVFRHVDDAWLAAAAFSVHSNRMQASGNPWRTLSGWRMGLHAPVVYHFADETGAETSVELSSCTVGARGSLRGDVVVRRESGDGATVHAEFWPTPPSVTSRQRAMIQFAGVLRSVDIARNESSLWVGEEGAACGLQLLRRQDRLDKVLASLGRSEGSADPDIRSPMPGTVVAVSAQNGDSVAAGQLLLAVEAMKMEHQLVASMSGTVNIAVKPGDLVKANEIVASIHPAAPSSEGAATIEGGPSNA